MAEREGTPMVEGPAHGVLGTLWLVGKKTGVDLQSFPIDAEVMTIGRDIDSDMRLYYSDVSKLHCELKFDLPSGDAFLHVHGRLGVKHALQSGEFIDYTPPSIIPLSDKDEFIVRKKLFRFEYGHQDAVIDTPPTQTQALPSDSPVKAATPVPFQRRKRVSHRMSLVPSGKNFEPFASPMKSRRHSIIGLGEGPKMVRTPKKSALSRQLEEEEEQEAEEEEEVVVEAVEGEEGDVLYFEAREDESLSQAKSVHNNPFMTPQQKRKAPIRNTSAVPRTRKLASTSAAPVTQEAEAEADGTASPRTPRSVPLPLSAETPYASVENSPVAPVHTPRSVPLPPPNKTPYVVSAQVAMSTPKGPVSLHKALLLRSARKAWQSNQAQGVDGAIQSGSVTTKRKSLSPSTKSRKSLSAVPVVEDPEEEDEEDEDEDGEEQEGELQWVYEDGTAAQSFDESDSSIDSLEADQSLDIPGQGVMSFGTAHEEDELLEEEAALNDPYEEDIEAEDHDEDSFEAQELEGAELNRQDQLRDEEDFDDVDEEESCEAEDMEETEFNGPDDLEEDGPDQEPAQSYRPLERFYTPQPRRTLGSTGPRRSLASFGGPATRPARMPETPVSTVRRMPGTPGTLGLPSRRIAPPVEEDADEEEEGADPSTPVKRDNAALLAEAKRRRETLGTPRTFPTLPASFKTPVRGASLRDEVRTPSHPALAPTTPESEAGDIELKPAVPLTPAQKVQKKLDTLRRQSLHRLKSDSSRRATVSFALPTTPARPQAEASASYTVVGQRRTFAMTKEEDEDVSEPGTPVMAGRDEGDVSSLQTSLHATGDMEEDEDVGEYEEVKDEPEAGPATPAFAGMKEMFRSAPPPKTPSFAGVRDMFPPTPQAAPTPHYNGMRSMFHQPQEPATPHMNGMREMYNLPQDPATPDMEGLGEMYELEEVEQAAALESDTESEEEEMVEEGSEIIAVISPVKPVSKPVPAPKKKAPTASRLPAPIASSSVASSSKVPAAPARTTASKVPVATASARSKTTPPVVEKKTALAAAKKSATASASTAVPRARPTTKATTTKKAVAAPAVRPRSGDIDDVSMSEIDEPVEFYEAAKSKAEVPKPKTVRPTATRAKKVEEPAEPVPVKKTASWSTSASSRAKKPVLGENDDQPQSAIPAPAPAKATRAKKAAVEKAALSSEKTSTSTTATRKTATKAKVEKENEPEVEKVAVPAAVKKAPVKRTVKKAEAVVAETVPVVATRTTRSKK